LKWHLPNILVILRIILIPVFLFFVLRIVPGESVMRWLALIVFIAAAISDFFDGYYARKWSMVSSFGKLMDPLADKMLVSAALIALVYMQYLAVWIVVVIICREFWVTALRLLALEQGRDVIAASIWGKIKTVLQMVMIITLITGFGTADFLLPIDFGQAGNVVVSVLIYLSLIATVFSAYEYTKSYKDVFLG